MAIDIFFMGLSAYLIGFFVCFFLMPRFEEAKLESFIFGIVFASASFFLLFSVFDGMKNMTFADVIEQFTLIIMLVIYLLGTFAGLVVTLFVPEKGSW